MRLWGVFAVCATAVAAVGVWGSGWAITASWAMVILSGYTAFLRQPLPLVAAFTLVTIFSPLGLVVRFGAWEFALFSAMATVISVAVGVAMRYQADSAASQARDMLRADIANELHDLVAHEVTGIVVVAQALRQTAGAGEGMSGMAQGLEQIERAGGRALRELRATVASLNPPVSSASVSEIERTVADMRARGVRIDFDTSGDLIGCAPASLVSAHRILTEALGNATRHAPTAPISVSLRRQADTVQLEVSNPLDPAADGAEGGGYGLGSMRRRASAIGGGVTAGPVGDEWVVQAELPAAGVSL